MPAYDWNERLFLFVNGGLGSPALDPLFVALSWIGSWAVAVPVIAILARADGRVFLRRHLPRIVLGGLAALAITQAAKDHFAVERPVQHFRQEIHRGELAVRTPDGIVLRRRSFPSGHAALAFFFLGYLSLVHRKHARWALPLACGIAIARVYVGAHFPLDVLAGGGVGLACAGACVWLPGALGAARRWGPRSVAGR